MKSVVKDAGSSQSLHLNLKGYWAEATLKKSFPSGTLCYYFKNAFLSPIPRDSAKLLNAASDSNS